LGGLGRRKAHHFWKTDFIHLAKVVVGTPCKAYISAYFWEALVHGQVRFNRVPGGFGAERGQTQQGSGEGSGEGLGGFGADCQVKICSLYITHGNPAEVFPALGFAAGFRKICQNKMLRLLGIPSKLIFR